MARGKNKLNNCSDNLEWCTQSYNSLYSKCSIRPANSPIGKKIILKVAQDGSTIERYKSIGGAARSNKIDVQMLHSIIRRGRVLMRRHNRPDEFMDMFDSRGDRFSDRFNESGMGGNDMDRMMRYMRNSMRNSMSGEHFTESEAKYLVADMYHTENGRKYSGEKFDMHKAKEICERYRGILPTSVTVADVYVAINSQYHDYAELFKNWFGDGIEQKIVESAIVFWFKDADCKAENKVVEYLGEY